MTRTLSLAPLTVLELAPPDMVSCAAQAGYSHLGLRLLPVLPKMDVNHPIIGDTPMVREVLGRLGDTGLKVLDIEFIRLTPESRVADYAPMLETGARLGAQHVLAGGDDPHEQRLAERFAELCDAAAPFGLTANLEPIPLFELRTLAQAMRVLAAADRPNSGILIDPIHFDRSGERLADAARIPRKWLHYMQLCDASAAIGTSRAIGISRGSARSSPGRSSPPSPGIMRSNRAWNCSPAASAGRSALASHSCM